ncbi:MAG: DUF5012 domain-containing protein [Bacteroidetes bacterium]|nr:DUF5012 domain-containing protein [Bacteroidota bacterium]
MKTTIRILLLFVLALSLTNCEKDLESEGLFRITYYAEITLEGGNISIPIGGTYTEPGFAGEENGVDKTSDIVVSDDIDASVIGVYSVDYALENADGYSTGASRTVVVYDPAAPEDDFSGTYSTAIVRTEGDGTNPRDYAAETTITKLGPGFFEVSCLLGGTYSIGYGYGSAYAMHSYYILNADYTLTLISGDVAGWGDSAEGFQNGVYDPGTGLPYWETIYANGDIYAVTCSN